MRLNFRGGGEGRERVCGSKESPKNQCGQHSKRARKKTIVQVSPSLHPSALKCIDMVRENQMLITLGKYRFSLYQAYLSGKEEPQGILKFVSIYFV